MSEKTYHRWRAPTGAEITGTYEMLYAEAYIGGITDDGEPDYLGESEVLWDTQVTVERAGQKVFVDENGAQWLFNQLVKIEESDDAPTA